MNAGGETADQVVRMSLQGIEVAANVALKAGGMASKSLAAMLYAILTDKKKVKGKARLNTMLKSGKELKVFAIHHNDLKVFCQEAKRYGVMYCVLKEKNTDGICDIMVRAEDASKISRIVDKFELATVDAKTINDYATSKQNQIFKDVPTMSDEEHDKLVQSLMNSMKKEEKSFSENPTTARTTKDASPFEPTSVKAGKEPNIIDKRPSVRKELNEIKKQQEKKRTVKQQSQHKNIKKKKIKKKVR
ncbi:MAG: PcfB family protein [Massilimicrobiota sp.]|nr:PcfB family protein [Massilimicrobiota sp.]